RPQAATGPVQFEECSTPLAPPPQPLQFDAAAPRLTPTDYIRWAATLQAILRFVARNFREVLVVAALPMPQTSEVAASQEQPAPSLTQNLHAVVKAVMPEPKAGLSGLDIGISTAFLQLSYPWLKTSGSHVLLEGLEPPDGALVGMLARNALARGTFTSA